LGILDLGLRKAGQFFQSAFRNQINKLVNKLAKHDGFVKSRNFSFFVIPAKAGIQYFQ